MEPNEILQTAREALDQAIKQKQQNKELIASIGPAILDILKPILTEISKNSKLNKEELSDIISNIKIVIPNIEVPKSLVEVKIPEIKIPTPVVNVSTPDINLPARDMADTNKILTALLKKENKPETIDITANLKII